MKAWYLLFPVLVISAIAMAPQGAQEPADAALAEQVVVMPITELQYVTPQGTLQAVPARNVVEIRLLQDHPHAIRLELLYDNGDYSLISAQSFHILRENGSTREVRLVRSKESRMRFPKLP